MCQESISGHAFSSCCCCAGCCCCCCYCCCFSCCCCYLLLLLLLLLLLPWLLLLLLALFLLLLLLYVLLLLLLLLLLLQSVSSDQQPGMHATESIQSIAHLCRIRSVPLCCLLGKLANIFPLRDFPAQITVAAIDFLFVFLNALASELHATSSPVYPERQQKTLP